MHPKRGMWVRFIRALRLAEYAKRPALAFWRETDATFRYLELTVYPAAPPPPT